MVVPTVFPPFLTISTKLLLEFIEPMDLRDKKFLELGCGCGIISILAAKKGAVVTATDINNAALEALKANSAKNNIDIEILHSDLFEKLHGSAFDIIVINPPYYPKTAQSIGENAWFCGENFEYFKNLFSQLPEFISTKTDVCMILSEDCNLDSIKSIAVDNRITFDLIYSKSVTAEKNFIFNLRLF